jgi:serine/threonine-protein kinase
MNGPQRPTDRLAECPGLESTDPDRTEDRPAAPAPGAGPAAETGAFTPVPPTGHASGGGVDGPDTAGSTGETRTFVRTPHPDTAPPEAGATTADAPADGDRGATASFVLARDVEAEDTERTLPPPDEPRGDGLPQVAGYRMLEVLGAGGMGIVYKAHQTRLDRFVALKMIRAGAGARAGDLVRFEAEARAVAAIDHPNIIQIHEIGEHGGLPYFSLEYLAGGSLARRIDGKPQPVAEAARIVEVLARAMDVAHRRGIIHRDLKPANVLLAPDGTLKIADFGLAKRLEADSSQTRTGSILGSPSYMAPEQALGAALVGPAADQYALGATLYELLTGRPPFRGISVLDTLDLVRTKEPVPPSQLLPRMPRDIETICLKCLEKDPARRYPDVAALADDLHRFQAGEPIVARPISGPERAWRWCLRNRRVAALTAAVALLLVAVAAVSAYSAVTLGEKNRELGETNVALGKANKDLIAAGAEVEAKRKLAVAAGQAAIKQNRSVVDAQREMIDLLEDKLRYEPNLQPVREKLLDLATRTLESAADTMTALRSEIGWLPADEELNWRTVARAHQRIGELSLSRNRFADALKQFRRVDELIARFAAVAPDDPAAQIRLIRTQRQLGFFARDKIGDIDWARRRFLGAMEIARALLAKDPKNDVYKNELANSVGQLAKAEMDLGHLERARELYGEERAIRDSFTPGWAGRLEVRRELAGCYEQVSELYFRLGDRDEARRFNGRCTELREGAIAEQPGSWPVVYDLARAYNNSGQLCFPRGRDPAAAREFHRKALALISKRADADPSNLDTQGRLAQTLYYEATCALMSRDVAGAVAGYRHCLKIREKLATEPEAKMPRIDLMVALARCGQHARAAAIAHELVATPPENEQIYFQAACGYALAAGAARDERRTLQSARGSLRSAIAAGVDALLVRLYSGRAIDCLRRGKARGWADVVSLETDPDLEPIRSDPAFRALLAEFRPPGEKRP